MCYIGLYIITQELRNRAYRISHLNDIEVQGSINPMHLNRFSPGFAHVGVHHCVLESLFYILSFLSVGFIRVVAIAFEFPYIGIWSLPLSSLMVQWFFSIFPYTRTTYLYFSSKGFSILSGGPTFFFVIFWLISL